MSKAKAREISEILYEALRSHPGDVMLVDNPTGHYLEWETDEGIVRVDFNGGEDGVKLYVVAS